MATPSTAPSTTEAPRTLLGSARQAATAFFQRPIKNRTLVRDARAGCCLEHPACPRSGHCWVRARRPRSPGNDRGGRAPSAVGSPAGGHRRPCASLAEPLRLFALAGPSTQAVPPARIANKKRPRGVSSEPFTQLARQRPTLPHGCPCSTIGSEELDFRVRDGIGYGLFDIATGNLWASNSSKVMLRSHAGQPIRVARHVSSLRR